MDSGYAVGPEPGVQQCLDEERNHSVALKKNSEAARGGTFADDDVDSNAQGTAQMSHQANNSKSQMVTKENKK